LIFRLFDDEFMLSEANRLSYKECVQFQEIMAKDLRSLPGFESCLAEVEKEAEPPVLKYLPSLSAYLHHAWPATSTTQFARVNPERGRCKCTAPIRA